MGKLNVRPFHGYSGERAVDDVVSYPVGEEKRVAAGLNALDRRSSERVARLIGESFHNEGLPREGDRVVPFVFFSLHGEEGDDRAVALLGHVLLGVTPACDIDMSLRQPNAKGLFRPALLVRGSDRQWYGYGGELIEQAAHDFVRRELSRRVILDPTHSPYDSLVESIDFEEEALALIGIADQDQWEDYAQTILVPETQEVA